MKRETIRPTPYHSLALGPLCKGCERCVRGEKLVVFVTGVCPARCFYCPISPEKKQRDLIFANERPVTTDEDLIAEAESISATGASFTGGDPLARLDRTIRYITLLKERFSREFHLHLYTPLNLVTEERLAQLHEAGLDEIRFHPFLEKEGWWPRVELARSFDWTVGVEIPVLPDKVEETKKLLTFLKGKIDFLNLNELEASDLNLDELRRRGYTVTPGSYAVEGCEAAARELIAFVAAEALGYPVHYCTCTLKDLVQMGNRLKRQAATSKLPFDVVDEEGLVTRGAVYRELLPGPGYEKLIGGLSEEERAAELAALDKVVADLKALGLQEFEIDYHKPRVLVPAEWLVEHAAEIRWPAAVVTEYPTWDSFPIEIEFVNGELEL